MVKSQLSKLALCAAGGAVALVTAAGPALAAPSATVVSSKSDTTTVAGYYKGRVIAKTGLNVRTKPSTSGKIIGTLKYNAYVQIKCKVNGQVIGGNPRWYKVKVGHKWGYASARYIANVGPAPKFC